MIQTSFILPEDKRWTILRIPSRSNFYKCSIDLHWNNGNGMEKNGWKDVSTSVKQHRGPGTAEAQMTHPHRSPANLHQFCPPDSSFFCAEPQCGAKEFGGNSE